MVYEAIDLQYLISIGSYLYFFKQLAPLKVFKNMLFYHILKDFLITPVNVRYIHAILNKNNDFEYTCMVSSPARNGLLT